jgi:hypothetical protein
MMVGMNGVFGLSLGYGFMEAPPFEAKKGWASPDFSDGSLSL